MFRQNGNLAYKMHAKEKKNTNITITNEGHEPKSRGDGEMRCCGRTFADPHS